LGHRKPDLILWTGDSISHDLTGIIEEHVYDSIIKLTSLIKKAFPGTPLLLCLGNHDFEPANHQFFDQPYTAFLQKLAEIWFESFLGQSSAFEKFQEYGYFALDAPPHIGDNLRIISINTQSCYVFNAGLTKELNDAGNQLHWLHEELQMAEDSGKVVWIIGHVPIGWKDCIAKWALRFTALVERYQHIIRFQSFGHIHTETFDVVRSLSTNKPIGVEFIAGNFGTYDGYNPTARLYQIHAKYHVPLDF
jgi:sphingomyelin phosphodiesterase